MKTKPMEKKKEEKKKRKKANRLCMSHKTTKSLNKLSGS